MPLRLAEDPLLAHAFGASTPFRVGVEEELFLVDPQTRQISHRTDELLARRPGRFARGAIVPEFCEGVIELATPVCASVEAAGQALGCLRRAVLRHDRVRLLGAGMHPTARFGDVQRRSGEHYDAVASYVGGVLHQQAYCGVHVHVAMADPEMAIAAYNGMRKWVPLLQALGANSPFWHGQDSGLASCRTVRCHSLPRSGLPRAFRDWADYRETMGELLRVSGADSLDSFWWDMRPHPKLGTIEVRALDAQSSLGDLEGLAALVHCLVHHEALVVDSRHPSKELLDEASFHAIRDGLQARLSVGGPIRHVHALAREALELASGYAPQLGCARALDEVERLLAEGNGADRQRRAHATGGLSRTLAQLVRETCSVPAPAPEEVVVAAARGAA